MNVDEMQKKLSQKATKEPEHHFENLYGLLCHEVWLRVAAHTVLQNKGSGTAGIDGMTKSNFLGDPDGYIRSLQELLKAKTFEPEPVKRVYIPKPNSEKKRPLGIPILLDRIVQEALRMILEPIWEADFSTHSYGFRPNRSTYDAMTYIGKRLASSAGQAYQWVIEGDIASYFDTIPHRRLIKAVKKRVADRDIRDLLWKFLRAGVMHQGTTKATLSGTPQGGIALPLQSCKLFFSGSLSPGYGSIRNTILTSSRATSTRLTSARMRSRLLVQLVAAKPSWSVAAKSSRRPIISCNSPCKAASSASAWRCSSRRARRWRRRVTLGSNSPLSMRPSA